MRDNKSDAGIGRMFLMNDDADKVQPERKDMGPVPVRPIRKGEADFGNPFGFAPAVKRGRLAIDV